MGSCVDYSLQRVQLLTREEERALVLLAKAGDLRARNRLVEANLRFAMRFARIYSKYKPDQLYDLFNEASMGIIRAIESFDLSKDMKFITYAVWWVRQKVFKYMSEDELIRIPNNTKLDDARYRKKYQAAINVGKMPEHCIDDYPQISQLDITIDNGEIVQNWAVPSTDFDSASSDVNDQMRDNVHKHLLDLAFDGIVDRNRMIVLTHYSGKTYNDISIEYKISKERVRQIVMQSLNRMKANNLRFGLHRKYLINL